MMQRRRKTPLQVLLAHYISAPGFNDLVKLRHRKSNLPGHTGGNWMFVCPVTCKPRRVLYLHDGHFKSREALPPGTLYKCQTFTSYFRTIGRAFDYYDALAALGNTLRKPYGKMFYRGKPTRKTNRLMKIDDRYEKVVFQWLREHGDR
jgi:hypothetical protein